MDQGNPYAWPTGNLQRPNTVEHAYFTGAPATPYPHPIYPPLTPRLDPISVPPVHPFPNQALGSWFFTPVPTPFPIPTAPLPSYQIPTPAPPPAVEDLPPLVADVSREEDEFPVPTPYSYHWPLPSLPPGPVPPLSYVATPVILPRRRRRRRKVPQIPASDITLQSARMRALDEKLVPILSVPRFRVKGRPSHWRTGYRPTVSVKMKSCLSKPACVSSTETLNLLLQYQPPRDFPLFLDLRSSYTTTLFSNPERPSTLVDMYQLATTPPTHEMKLYHPLLPWYIDVYASSSSGITVYDVLYQLCASLQDPIVHSDFYNDVITAEEREQVAYAYHLRGDLPGGMRKVDFLGPQIIFRGLRRTRDGWYIKTTI
ncbi:hypothetical protein GYMLUDRAFT_36712 [Collybiopsis luxurians FD-317 M1]|nr:hypothetical protein GYMLUDRAFT_36712 [Collybiopsis luxurians FD-317 M1]